MPVLTVIAGPNGSGKSTLTNALDFAGRENLLDPDAIARELDPFDPRLAAFAGGRELVRRIQYYLANGLVMRSRQPWRAGEPSKQCATQRSTASG